MRRNAPLLVVLLLGLVSALGIVGAASLRAVDPRPEDVAIRVDGVEVTFAELEMRRSVSEATRGVSERMLDGEDFGMPPESLEQARMLRDLFAPMAPSVDANLELVAGAVPNIAAYAAAVEAGVPPTAEEIDRHLEFLEQVAVYAESGPTEDQRVLGFAAALREAQVAALGEDHYRNEWLPLSARDAVARSRLADHLDLSAAEAGITPIRLATEAAASADLWVHPSLDVTVDDLHTHLDQQWRYMQALQRLGEELQADFES